MSQRSDRIASFIELGMSLMLAMVIGWIAANAGDINTSKGRSIVFAIVVTWACLEVVPIILHMTRYGADGLSASMAASRLMIINYFGALALNLSGLVVVHAPYFTWSRMMLAIACGGAAFFLARESWWAFDDLSSAGKIVTSVTLMSMVAAVFFLIISF